jgi:hypothetical protein
VQQEQHEEQHRRTPSGATALVGRGSDRVVLLFVLHWIFLRW